MIFSNACWYSGFVISIGRRRGLPRGSFVISILLFFFPGTIPAIVKVTLMERWFAVVAVFGKNISGCDELLMGHSAFSARRGPRPEFGF